MKSVLLVGLISLMYAVSVSACGDGVAQPKSANSASSLSSSEETDEAPVSDSPGEFVSVEDMKSKRESAQEKYFDHFSIFNSPNSFFGLNTSLYIGFVFDLVNFS